MSVKMGVVINPRSEYLSGLKGAFARTRQENVSCVDGRALNSEGMHRREAMFEPERGSPLETAQTWGRFGVYSERSGKEWRVKSLKDGEALCSRDASPASIRARSQSPKRCNRLRGKAAHLCGAYDRNRVAPITKQGSKEQQARHASVAWVSLTRALRNSTS